MRILLLASDQWRMLDFALGFPAPIDAWNSERQTPVPFINSALAALKRIVIVILIAIAFSVGLFGAIILSLHSSQTKVPDIVGKDRAAAEDAITAAHLNFRVRATRAVSDAKPNTVIIQIPSAGEEVKVGQTVAVDLSRPAKEGETPAPVSMENKAEKSENGNAGERASASNSNENKPRRNKNSNKNANDNTANANRNRNANADSNRAVSGNQNTTPAGTPTIGNRNPNSNRAPANVNRTGTNLNLNRRRPAASPTP